MACRPPADFTVVGPLCFAVDVLARDLPLPAVAPGDLVLVRDTGAYTLSMGSRHCSRAIPVVIGLDGGAPRMLRPPESVGVLVGVDRFLDMCRTTLNVAGDLVIAACVEGAEERVLPS